MELEEEGVGEDKGGGVTYLFERCHVITMSLGQSRKTRLCNVPQQS